MRLSKRQRRLWQYMIRQLRTHFDPGVPVEVRTVDHLKIDGESEGVIKLGRMVKIVIRISRKAPWKLKADALLHERGADLAGRGAPAMQRAGARLGIGLAMDLLGVQSRPLQRAGHIGQGVPVVNAFFGHCAGRIGDDAEDAVLPATQS